MKAKRLMIGAFASLAILVSACGGYTKTAKDGHVHTEGDGHDHGTELVEKPAEKAVSNRNEKDQLVDAAGHLIVGCPMHKEMVGSEGDKCPKCNYMEMVPITWSLEGIDTVRVTTLPDYNPPKN